MGFSKRPSGQSRGTVHGQAALPWTRRQRGYANVLARIRRSTRNTVCLLVYFKSVNPVMGTFVIRRLKWIIHPHIKDSARNVPSEFHSHRQRVRMPLAVEEDITINKQLTDTLWQIMTERRVSLAEAGSAVVAPFAHMLARAHIHTHSESISELIHEKRIWAELAAQTHVHTERLRPHWSASLHPTTGVSEGSAAVLCSRGLERLERAIFPPLTSIFGLDIEGPQLPSFSRFFSQRTGSQCALPARLQSRLCRCITAARPVNKEMQHDTAEATRICAIS